MIGSLGALSFTAPWVLAALAALPAIWLLLRATPPSPQRVRFPAFIILRKLSTKEETPDRTPWWLLLLRLLLAAIVILGLAGPVLNAPVSAPGSGPLIFVVDDTYPAAPAWRLRLDALRLGAEEAAQSGRAIFFLTTADPSASDTPAPMTGEEARSVFDALRPRPFPADRAGAADRLAALDAALATTKGAPEIRWLSDGVASRSDAAFVKALAERGALSIFIDRANPQLILRAGTEQGARWRVERLRANAAWEGTLVATARDGRVLARAPVALDAGSRSDGADFDLPLALRNDTAAVSIEDHTSAGAVQLADARDRRALVGLITGEGVQSDALLSGTHYVRTALAPFAEFLVDRLENLIASDASVIVLDDVGRLRPSDVDALTAWVDRGGVLIRFAGPNLAAAALDAEPPLLPVMLR
ncbi:MAG: BatA domain-containing protein, partial [Amphiplicatus sp.]